MVYIEEVLWVIPFLDFVIISQFPLPEAPVWGWLHSYLGKGEVFSYYKLLFSLQQSFPYKRPSSLSISLMINFLFQSAPCASPAADIVYQHIPSATCVSEVFLCLHLGFFVK